MADIFRKKIREVHDMQQNAEEIELSTEEFDVV